jgi:hypothetical protein
MRARLPAAALSLLLAAACSAASPDNSAGERTVSGYGGTGGSGGSQPSVGTGGSSAAPNLGSGGSAGGTDPNECASAAFEAEPVPVDLAIMLDQSGSMAQPSSGGGTLWSAVTGALTTFVTSPKAGGIGVSLAYFPGQGCNVAGYATPDVPMAALPGNASAVQTSLSWHFPNGMTPTGPALSGAIQYALGYAQSNPGHKVAVVLATDGMPTECSPQDIGSIAQIAAAAYNGTPSVPTFVIGVGGALTALNTIAIAGGTGQAFIVDTNAGAGDQFLQALEKIKVAALACEYAIPTGTEPVDYTKVNVEITPSGGTPTTIPGVGDASKCGTNPGWFYDDPLKPTKIILCPATCDSISGDSAAKISIVLGCDTVVPS